MVIYLEWFDSWYCYLTFNKTFWILAENFKQGCQYCILRVEINDFRKDIFFWNKLSVSISFRILSEKSWDNQQKKVRTVQTGIEVSGGKNWGKNVALEYLEIYTFVRTVMETRSKFRLKSVFCVLKLPCTCPNEKFARNDFLSNLSISNFFPDFDLKISSSVIKTYFYTSSWTYEEWRFDSK